MDTLSELINIVETQRINGVKCCEISAANMEFITDAEPSGKPVQKSVDKRVENQQNPGDNQLTYLPPEDVVSEGLSVNLLELTQMVKTCQKCSFCHGSNYRLSGIGNSNAKLMFIGDSPEIDDDNTGSLLSGPAGKLLTEIIKAMTFTPDKVYITNIVKCYSHGKQLVNEKENVSLCIPYLRREIELVKPQVIVLLGPSPLKYMFDKGPIGKYRGQWFSYKSIDYIATYNPSYLLRIPKAKRDVWNDMKQVMKKLGIDWRTGRGQIS